MLRASLTGLLANKLRLSLTALAIVIGVAFVSGSFVFTDTINARFERLIGDVSSGVDVYVRPAQPDFVDSFQNAELASLDAAVLDDVAAFEGVDRASGGVAGFAQLVGPDGEPIGGQGPPTLGFSWTEDPGFNPLRIAPENGRSPERADEIVVDVATATRHGLAVGDEIVVLTLVGPGTYRIVGLANFGDEDSLAGATLTAFTLAEAQRVFGLEGRLSSIDVAAADGVDPRALATDLDAALGTEVEAVTADQADAEQLADIAEGLGFLNTALLAFAGVAIFVGAFIITNTFRIIVAQRTRELALYRAIGATGRQVTAMVLIEALAVAVVASTVGIGGGVILSEILASAMNALGFSLPDGPLTVLPRTVVVGLAVGIGVTLFAALLPARKASKVPPIAALRDDAARPRRRSLRARTIGGAVLVGIGLLGLAVGLLAGVANPLAYVGAGALVFFLGVSVLAPLAAKPVAIVLGFPVARLFGVAGTLARENTMRQPRRTAATASALTIGVAMVVFVAIFAASIKSTVADTVRSTFPADFTITSTNFDGGISRSLTEELKTIDEVGTVSALVFDQAAFDGSGIAIVAVDPNTAGAVVDLDAGEGAFAAMAETDGVLVARSFLDDHGLAVGDDLTLSFPRALDRKLPIVGSFGNADLAPVAITRTTYDAGFTNRFDDLVLAVAAGDMAEARAAVEAVAEPYANVQVQTKDEAIAEAEQQIDQLLALFSGLLFLAIVIAVLGITNTLVLSIIERTREIGLLRALGMVRRQTRRMVRWEAVIIAVFGAVMGILTGTFLGWAVVRSLADEGLGSFAIPVGQLVTLVLLAGLAGVVAAIYPSWKASRVAILEAIAYE